MILSTVLKESAGTYIDEIEMEGLINRAKKLEQENEDLKAEVAKFRGKNNYKSLRIKRLIKRGLDRMVQIEKLETENKTLRGE